MNDFKSKLRDLVYTSFGDEKTRTIPNTPNNRMINPSYTKQNSGYDTVTNSTSKKFHFDFSIENYKKKANASPSKHDLRSEKRTATGSSQKSDYYTKSNKSNGNSMNQLKELNQSSNKKTINLFDTLNYGTEPKRRNSVYDFNRLGGLSKSIAEKRPKVNQSYSLLNKSRENYLNTTIGNTSTIWKSGFGNNSKLLKEIQNFSSSLKDNSGKFNYQKPTSILSKLELETNNKGVLDFSPVNVRKNYLVTGISSKFNGGNMGNSSVKPKRETNFIKLTYSDKNGKSEGRKDSFFINFNEKKPQQLPKFDEESIEEFSKHLDPSRKESIVAKYSPKKRPAHK